MFLVCFGEPGGGRRGTLALMRPGPSCALFLWANLSQSVAGLLSSSRKRGRRWPLYSHGSQSLLQTSWGPCACPCTHVRLWGHTTSNVLTVTRPPVQQERHFFFWENLNESPICSQRESFCFGKVSSFRHGREGTREELKTPEKEEVRVKGGGKELG